MCVTLLTCFDYLQVSVSVVAVSFETFSTIAAANVTTQSISDWLAKTANGRVAKWCAVAVSLLLAITSHPLSCILSFLMTSHHLPLNLCN